jgi:tetratricopeptide (TPR) repeat protein
MKVVSSSLAPNWELTWSRLIDHNTIPILCLVHRKSLVHDVGYFRDLPAVEDWDMLLRLASVSEVAHVPRVTYEYYVNLNKQTGNESWRRQNPAAYLALVNAIREYQNPPIFLMDGQGVPSNRQELVRRLERFLSERPDCYGIWKTYGAELMQLREYNLALKALQMGLVARESDDQGRQLYRLISICYSHLQEPATAKACFTKSRQAVMGSTGANDAELPHLEGGALLDSISSAPLHGIVYYYLYSQRFGHRAALKKIAKHLQSKL